MARLNLTRAIGLVVFGIRTVCANVFEQLDEVPRDWTYVRQADLDQPVKLHIALRQQNVEYFEQLVLDVSTPGHPKYGKHLEGHEVNDILKPSEHASNAIISWLQENNITAILEDGDFVDFATTVGNANHMLNTEFGWYKERERGQEILRTLAYSVPAIVAENIDFVQPTTKFGSVRPFRSTIHSVGTPDTKFQQWKVSPSAIDATAPPNAICNNIITPQCLLQLYNVHYGANATNGNKVSYASFLNEYARYTDLTIFENTIASYADGKNFSVIQFNGGGNDQTSTNDSTEANLDNQYIIGVGYPTPVTEFSTGGCGPLIPDMDEPAGACDNEPYLAFLKGIMKLPNSQLPQTLSVSYGDDEQTLPISFTHRVCKMFAMLGARGVSVMFASGDFGPGKTCENNNGTVKKFVPAFPAGCPYVTAVGATVGVPTEQGASFTGGGFSNYFPRPSYQAKMVSTYLKSIGNTFAPYYNHEGRGYPDVSAQGVQFLVVNDGVAEPVDGTSAASPTFSAIVALLNSARISAGMAPLGFMNPFLYSRGYTALNDITAGGSTGCSASTIPGASWNATKGWDPATGLGTPNFGKLLSLLVPSACNVGGPLPNPTLTAC